MPYVDNPEYVRPNPVTYDVLLDTTDGPRLVEVCEDRGGLGETALAVAREQHHALTDAWVTGSRVWSETAPPVIEMGPGDGGITDDAAVGVRA